MREFIAQIVFGFCMLMLLHFGDGLAEKAIIAVLALTTGISCGVFARGCK